MPIDVFTDWIFEIDGATETVRFSRPNLFATKTSILLGTGAKRGSDVLMPRGDGLRARRRRPTSTERTIPVFVTGLFDEDGDREPDPSDALDQMLDYLDRELVTDPDTDEGTLVGRLIRPGSIRETDLHVLDYEIARDDLGPYTLELGLSLNLARRFAVVTGS